MKPKTLAGKSKLNPKPTPRDKSLGSLPSGAPYSQSETLRTGRKVLPSNPGDSLKIK
jgi:hypothetical protein